MTDETHQQWTDKHRPTSFNQIQGNNAAIDRLKDWAEKFPQDTTGKLLVGPPGTGKTTTVEVIADWLDLQLVELNASSARTGDDIEEMAAAVNNQPPDSQYRVVLLDEVDSWHHASNKQPLYDALDDPNNLVFCTANDEWETPNALVSRCDTEKFKLSKRSRKAKLKKVADAEDLDLDDAILDRLAERPDLRSAINDLQVYGPSLGEAPEDDREWAMSEWDMVDAILTGTPSTGSHNVGECLLWLDENITKDWRGLELAWGYEALSRADTTMMVNTEMAESIIEALAELRLTEPYYDDGIGRDKEFPEWFQHSQPDATGKQADAQLYRALSNYESGEVGITCSFTRFRKVVLPQLRNLPKEERYQLVLDHGLTADEYEALDVQRGSYESWVEAEEPTKGDGLQRTEDASLW